MSRFASPHRLLAPLSATALIAAAASVFAVVLSLTWESRALWARGLGFLVGTQWDPVAQDFGALPMLFISTVVTVFALAVAVPLGVGAAVFIAELLPPRLSAGARTMLELLAGIPSIVYGLLGLALLVPWLEHTFDLLTGRTILAAGVLLGLMVLPTVSSLAEEAVRGVPRERREVAHGLGLTRAEVLRLCVLPAAVPGIAAGALLGLGRALGETMATMLVIGSLDRLPAPLYNLLVPAQSLTSKLGRESAEAAYGSPQWAALMALGLVLFVLVLAFTAVSQMLLSRREA